MGLGMGEFDSHRSDCDVREQANPAVCESVSDGSITRTSPRLLRAFALRTALDEDAHRLRLAAGDSRWPSLDWDAAWPHARCIVLKMRLVGQLS